MRRQRNGSLFVGIANGYGVTGGGGDGLATQRTQRTQRLHRGLQFIVVRGHHRLRDEGALQARPGLLESVYEGCLCHELSSAGLDFRRQVNIPIKYGNVSLSAGFRLDLLVNDTVVVEVKAVETLLAIHDAQLLTYLRITGKRLGLLLNFNTLHFRNGIRRRIN